MARATPDGHSSPISAHRSAAHKYPNVKKNSEELFVGKCCKKVSIINTQKVHGIPTYKFKVINTGLNRNIQGIWKTNIPYIA